MLVPLVVFGCLLSLFLFHPAFLIFRTEGNIDLLEALCAIVALLLGT